MSTIADYRDAFGDDHVFVISEASPRITLAVQAMGGSSGPDWPYGNNRFFYELRADDVVLDEGSDLCSGGALQSARQMAAMYVDDLCDSTGEFTEMANAAVREALADHWMTVKSWALDITDPEGE